MTSAAGESFNRYAEKKKVNVILHTLFFRKLCPLVIFSLELVFCTVIVKPLAIFLQN